MEIKIKPMGDYYTNCYIISTKKVDIIIDPGVGAFDWIKDNVKNPKAILNTHGHFDHIWDNKKVKEYFNIPIYCPIGDAFMLEEDVFNKNLPLSKADILVDGDKEFVVEDLKFKFIHFPGHTPGCSVVVINNLMFSGDFIFKGSIGRVDFPYSNVESMKKSIVKVLEFDIDYQIFPGHGEDTTLFLEKNFLTRWLKIL